MRYLWITIGVSLAHRLLTSGIAILAFAVGMGSFTGDSSAGLSMPLMGLAALLDFPVHMAAQWEGL